MKANYYKHILEFKRPSGTSRGVLKTKETWFIILEENGKKGIGECGILRTLSVDDRPDYEEKLKWVCNHIYLGKEKLYNELTEFPSIQFGVEQAFLSLKADNPFELFPSPFTKQKVPIPINGLIWMGEKAFMKQQIVEKLEQGFDCIKLKIGAIDFEAELDLLDTALDMIHEGRAPTPQDTSETSYWPRRSPADSALDVTKPLSEVFDAMRVADPDRYPAFFELRGHKYEIRLKKVTKDDT